MDDNQSNEVLKKNNLRTSIEFSVSSKLLLFISLQMNHIKQGGMIIQIWLFRWRTHRPYKQAKSSKTDFGITQWSPNKPNIMDHKSKAIEQCSKRWSTDSPLHLQI